MSNSTDLQQRYGRTARPSWFWPTVAAIGVTIGVAFAAWVGFQKDPVSARVYSYDIASDNLVTVNLDVVRPDPLDVRCTVYAQALDHSIVGEKTVDVASSSQEVERIEIDIQTERRAVTGTLRTCAQVR
ncbi:DUF4307 domain-containing protein [Aeromicrobium sp. CF3.5]|uniref:DUF4307 domain-containing protein n=1 Tax=Aeromicrobium sp. CF3.5 TaxID=3373078 RepID=UPI003EE6810B